MAQKAEGWHFDRTINLANVIAIIGIVAVGFGWKASVEQKISANTKDIQQLQEKSDRDWQLNKDARQDIKNDLKDIKTMLSQLLREQRK